MMSQVDVKSDAAPAKTTREEALTAHAAVLMTAGQDKVDKDALAKLVASKDLAVLCAAEAHYLAFMDGLATAISKDDVSFVENVPLPLKAHMGANDRDLKAARSFWTANLPADMPYELTLASVDDSKATGTVACVSCSTAFTAKHAAAVRRFLALVAHVPTPARLAGTLAHPLKLTFAGMKYYGNMRDRVELFDKALWAKHLAALLALPVWADVKTGVFEPIMAAKADALVMPANKARFTYVLEAHEDVTVGPWSMDLVRAVRRQRHFSAEMAAIATNDACVLQDFNTEALAQYPKFLAAIVAQPKDVFVPTSAIDLAWHTHQLSPAIYARQTLLLTGRVVNHDGSDNTASEARIPEGAKVMVGMWRVLYDEEYYAPVIPRAVATDFHAEALDTGMIFGHISSCAGTAFATHKGGDRFQHADCKVDATTQAVSCMKLKCLRC
ncbi:hypothetical protein AMAG_18884 [Allomyces macrogynus ATCC 38327]|uniref:Uncharacterized protein n=1 Tax=Allomyces macrogynus (strain ATCC 38327) TaxID=578462 RepID=A0A0L0SJ78_ALLM3|nr:hypothetical protein AMAG_18884 [Allomyces macrogynus ATCC 38327]|eukprot:KNE62558.1 hypothetical protein AMAG_18884 [Allomyces macrogynus ATCC 38327]